MIAVRGLRDGLPIGPVTPALVGRQAALADAVEPLDPAPPVSRRLAPATAYLIAGRLVTPGAPPARSGDGR
jgi:hypothetical protein